MSDTNIKSALSKSEYSLKTFAKSKPAIVEAFEFDSFDSEDKDRLKRCAI